MKKDLPKFSIIIPSLNQGRYIEESIESILKQNYPYKEVIVIDGGSTDGTQNILKRYGKKISWICEKDKGQSDAINKGMMMATGDIAAYLNADDYYLPESFSKIANFFLSHPDIQWVTGGYHIIDGKGKKIRPLVTLWKKFWMSTPEHRKLQYILLSVLNYICQPATFWKRTLFEDVGLFDTALHYTMDYDYWLRIIKTYRLGILREDIAIFRVHKDAKSTKFFTAQFAEGYKVMKTHVNSSFLRVLHQLHDKISVGLYNIFSYNE